MTSTSLTTAARLQQEIVRLTPAATTAADWRHLTDLHTAYGAAIRDAAQEMRPFSRESLV